VKDKEFSETFRHYLAKVLYREKHMSLIY